MRQETLDTLVLGAGISGLAYAHSRGPGAELLVLEAAERAGGLIRTVSVATPFPLRFEAGPEALSGTAREALDLARELALDVRAVPEGASRRYVVLDRRLVEVPLSPPRLLASRLLTWSGKLRLLSEPWRAPRTALDGSIADFARHRLGPEALERLVDPLVSGIHAGDPEQLSLRACFPQVAAWVEEHGSLHRALRARRPGRGDAPGLWKPRAGMEALPSALARALGDRLRLGARARELSRTGERWRVATDGGEFSARTAVLALPLRESTALLRDVAPEAAGALGPLQAESVVSAVHAYRRADVAHPLDGFGFLVPARERSLQLGTLFSSSIDPGCAPGDFVLLRTMLGGARHPEILSLADEEILTILVREVAPLLGIQAPPVWSNVWPHENALPRFDLEHPSRLRALESALPPGLHVLGNFTRGIGLGALVAAARELAAGHGQAASRVAARSV